MDQPIDVGDGRVSDGRHPSAQRRSAQSASPRVLPGTPRVRGEGLPRILVVDGEPFVRRVVSRLLSRQGFRTCTAADGEETLARLAEEDGKDIGLLVLDLHLPGAESEKLLERARELRPGLAALFMQSRMDGVTAPRPGGIPVLVKPFGSESLMVEVFAALDLERHLPG